MDATTALTALPAAAILVSALLTLPVSLWLLWLYRRATLRGMLASSESAQQRVVEPTPGATDHDSRLDVIHWMESSPPPASESGHALYRRVRRAQDAVSLACLSGGFAYALIMALAWMITAGGGFPPGRFLWLLACYLWPAVIALYLVRSTGVGTLRRLVGIYFLLVASCILFVMIRNPDTSIGQLVYFWVFANLPATLIFLSFLYYRIRAVGPLVLAFMLAGVTGAIVLVQIMGGDDALLRTYASLGSRLGMGATSLFLLLHLAGFIAFAIAGWFLLQWLGRRYRRKQLSDQTLMLDALFLAFGMVQSVTLAFEGWYWVFTGLVAFALYKLVTTLLLAGLSNRETADDAPMLLSLRVFALGRRSERFFDNFSRLWRYTGSISMIAGPDLVASAIEPHEFLEFVSGRLSRRFVKDRQDLDRRVDSMDREADPDGRYRVAEFFCHDDTWRMTMQCLADESDAILMDLRSFSEHNRGCLYELEQLIDRVDLSRVVFLVDETTDMSFLGQWIDRLWAQMATDSPNRQTTQPAIQFFHLQSQSAREFRLLLAVLARSM
jgi:hypothetical protein